MKANNDTSKQSILQAIIRGIEKQRRAFLLNYLGKFKAGKTETGDIPSASEIAASTDAELIVFAKEGIAALKAGQPIAAYVSLDLILTELQLRQIS